MQVNLGWGCFFSVVRVSRWSCEVCLESEVSYLLIWKRKGCIHFLISIASNDIYVQEFEAQLKLVYSTSLTPSSMLCSYYRDETNNLLNECHNSYYYSPLLFITRKTFCRKTNRSLYCQRPDFRIVSHPRLPGRPLGQIVRLGNVLTWGPNY